MKILILYFSGTGNTFFICKLIKNKIEEIINLYELNVSISMFSIEQINPQNIPEHDILILAFPVYETDSPSFFQNYIEKIPIIQNKGLFLICTHGGFPGNAIRKNFDRILKKGYIPLGYLDIGMGDSGSFTFMKKNSFIIKYIEKRDYSKSKKINKFVNKVCEIIIKLLKSFNEKKYYYFENYKINLPFNPMGSIFSWLWKFIYNIFGNYLIKRFWVDEKCNKCQICIKICPVKNIVLEDNKILFNNKCFLCFRCINQCPNEAIQIGKLTIGKYRYKGPDKSFNPLIFL